ncbi:MAG: Do family serine endopeptidase [bacterium]
MMTDTKGSVPTRAGILFAASVFFLAVSLVVFTTARQRDGNGGVVLEAASGVAGARRTPVVEAIEKASPAVVNISTEQVVRETLSPFRRFRDGFFDEFFEDFFDRFPTRDYTRQSLGSGVVIDEKGYILTNEHVIMRASKINVTLPDNREFEAKLVGADPKFDLAIIKIDVDRPLAAATVGDSDTLMIGETVIAIGNPFGLEHTVTTGVVSALKRSIKVDRDRVYSDFIQTDASINPGNSGGPLVNIAGEVVGINTAIFAQANGIGFAIPVNKAKRAVSDLLKYGAVKKAWIGLRAQELTPELAERFGYEHRRGVLVADVLADSPAAEAGVEPGDIISSVNGAPVSSVEDYYDKTSTLLVGERVALRIYRGGEALEAAFEAAALPIEQADRIALRLLGVRVGAIGSVEIMRYSLRTRRGVVVTRVEPGGFADRTGIEPGDVITQIGAKEIADVGDFREAVVVASERNNPVIVIRRGDFSYYTNVE